MPYSNSTKTNGQRALQNLHLPTLEDIYDVTRWDPSAVNPPRPANAFILFRAWLVLTRKKQLSNLKIKEISATISSEWMSATDEVRDHFNQLAASLKRKHNEIYPGYKYRPRKPCKDETIEAVSGRSSSVPKPTFPSSCFSHRGAQPSVPKARRDGLDGHHGHGRHPTGANTSLPQEPFSSGTPLIYGPFWLAYPPGSAPGSLQNSILLTNSPQSWGHDPALAPDPSDVLARISRNVHHSVTPTSEAGQGYIFPELFQVHVTHEPTGFPPLNPNSEWNWMLEHEPVAGSNCVAPSVYHGQRFAMDSYPADDPQALDDWMDEYIDFNN